MQFHTSSSVTQQVHPFWPGTSLWWVFCFCFFKFVLYELKQHLSIINQHIYNMCKRDMSKTYLHHIFPVHTEWEAVDFCPLPVWRTGAKATAEGAGHLQKQDLHLWRSSALPRGDQCKDKNIPNIYFRVQLLLIRRVKYGDNHFIFMFM